SVAARQNLAFAMHAELRFLLFLSPMRRAALLFTLTVFTTASGSTPAPDTSGDWVRPARDYASTRFSPLDQITPLNVRQLAVKSTFSTGVLHGHEAAPLVVHNTMYIVTPWPHYVYALDLSTDGAPVEWK